MHNNRWAGFRHNALSILGLRMKRILTVIFLFICSYGYGQNAYTKPLGSINTSDTNSAVGSIKIGRKLVQPLLATTDTNIIAGWDASGNMVWRYKSLPDTSRPSGKYASRYYVDSLGTGSHAALVKYSDSGTIYYSVYGVDSAKTALRTSIGLKQDALGYTPENVSNKATSTALGTSNTTYSSTGAVKTFTDSSSFGKKAYRIIIMGQSNAIGRADTADLHATPLSGIPDNIRGQFNRVWMADLYGTYYKLELAVTNRGYTAAAFGTEIAIAYRWLLTHPSGELFLNKYTIDGSAIANFLSGTSFYTNTLTVGYANSTTWLKNNGYDVVAAGLVWLQGESDYTDTWSTYYNKLNSLFTSMTTDGFISSRTRIVLSGISTHSTLWGAGVDSAFQIYASNTNHYARYIDNKTYTDLNSDSLHWNGHAMFRIGYEAVRLVFGADTMTPENHVVRLPFEVSKSSIGLGSVENTALSTWAGSTNITTLGTIATGIWNGTTIGSTYLPTAAADGSTKGIASFAAADFDASSGNISIDYANGQKASASVSGFVSTTTQTFAGAKTFSSDLSINGITSGRGGGNVSTNTSFGASAQAATATGGFNCWFGLGTGFLNTSGARNVAVGYNAMVANTTGTSNVAIGQSPLSSNKSGNQNIAIGRAALPTLTTGDDNIGIGFQSSNVLDSTSNVLSIGRDALKLLTRGTRNVALGNYSLQSLTTNNDNTSVGYASGGLTTGTGNSYFGYNSGSAITTGSYNVILGSFTGSGYTTVSNHIHLSDGQANVRAFCDNNGLWSFGATTPTARMHVKASTGYNQFRLETSYTPSSTADTNGNIGDMAWDDNYIYIKTTAGWKRSALSTF